MSAEMLKELRRYFNDKKEIAFAFLFGSAASTNLRRESDVDIAVYFQPERDLEWEDFDKRYKSENTIALDLEKLLKKEVDLVVLNRAKAVIADEILRKGRPIIIRDRGLFLEFFCIISDEAEEMRSWLESYYRETHLESNG